MQIVASTAHVNVAVSKSTRVARSFIEDNGRLITATTVKDGETRGEDARTFARARTANADMAVVARPSKC